MKKSESYRKVIAQEIDYVEGMMNKTKNIEEKLYFFSGIQGVIQRVFNFEYDSNLVYMRVILQNTYTSFLQRFQALKAGDTVVPLLEIQIEELVNLTKELGEKIKNNEDPIDTLKKFTLLAYSTTGNGYYLLQKGLLTIGE